MVSRAAKLLKMIEQDDNDPMTPPSTDTAVGDIPGDTAATDDQPHDNNTGAPDLQDLAQPDQMAEALDLIADKCDEYMDDQNTQCFTPQTDDEKNSVMEARGLARRAGQLVRGLKK
jgi:hypothetical protein